MADDDLLPGGEAPPPAARVREPRNVTCEFCGSKLTSQGEVLRLGEAARKFRDRDDRMERLQSENETLKARVQQLSDELQQRMGELRSIGERAEARGYDIF